MRKKIVWGNLKKKKKKKWWDLLIEPFSNKTPYFLTLIIMAINFYYITHLLKKLKQNHTAILFIDVWNGW